MHAWASMMELRLPAMVLGIAFTAAVALVVGAAVHEAGHAVIGRLVGFQIGSVGVGVARPLWVGRWGDTRLFVARSRPTAGITFAAFPSLDPSRWQSIAFAGGGILAQSVFGIAALWGSTVLPGRVVWLTAGAVNLFMACANLLPHVVRRGAFTIRTDGAMLLRILVAGAPQGSLRERVHILEGMREMWRDVGDTLTPRVNLHVVVLEWLQLPALEPARRAWDEIAALPGEPPRWLRLHGDIVGAVLAHASGDRDRATAILDRVDEELAREPHAGLSLLSPVARAGFLADAGDCTALTRLIDEDPRVRRKRPLRVALIAARARALAAQPGVDLDALEKAYWSTSRHHRTEASERALFLAVARAAVAREDIERARRAYRVALEAASRLLKGWTHAPSRQAFLDANAELLAEARAFFESHGSAADLLAVERFGVAEPEPEPAARQVHRVIRAAAMLPCWSP